MVLSFRNSRKNIKTVFCVPNFVTIILSQTVYVPLNTDYMVRLSFVKTQGLCVSILSLQTMSIQLDTDQSDLPLPKHQDFVPLWLKQTLNLSTNRLGSVFWQSSAHRKGHSPLNCSTIFISLFSHLKFLFNNHFIAFRVYLVDRFDLRVLVEFLLSTHWFDKQYWCNKSFCRDVHCRSTVVP